MTEQAPIDPGEIDPHLVAQAARAYAQRAVELARGLGSELHQTREEMWTRSEHEKFSHDSQAADAKARHRLNVLLTFSAIALVLIIGLWAFITANMSEDSHEIDERLTELSQAAVSSCERGNVTRQGTRDLYANLAKSLKGTDMGEIMAKALADLPPDTDCSLFERRVNP